MLFKPMLAAAVEDTERLPWPMIGSPKIDGIRCVKYEGRVLSRSLKLIPNVFVREALERELPEGADGEILAGGNFQECSSAVMSIDGEPDFVFCLFDMVLQAPYEERLKELERYDGLPHVMVVPTRMLRNAQDLDGYEEECLRDGFEGVCLRTPRSPYKYGRSTLREGYLLKIKRFTDAEAVVVGFEEQYRNTNPAELNELGHTKRSHTIAGREGKGTLGKLILETEAGVRFGLGTGFTDALRNSLWSERDTLAGRIVKFKSQKYGEKDAPRLPVFLGFRDKEDM